MTYQSSWLVSTSDGGHHIAAAHRNVGPRDITGQIGFQKGHDMGDLLVFTAASQGNRRLIRRLTLGTFTPHAVADRPSRGHLIDGDLVRADFLRQYPQNAVHAALASDIGR